MAAVDLPFLVPARDYAPLEIEGSLRAIPVWWELLVDGIDGGAAAVSALRAEQDALDAALDLAAADRAAIDAYVDASLALLQRAGRALAAAGAFPRASGTVDGLFLSDGGVPKQPVEAVEIDARGVVGDRQRSARHHGRPWQALCLWSAEVVERLAAEGHPITAGSAGENISVRGIDWRLARPGVRVALGPEVVAELSPYALPCSKNAQWFADGDFERMHHERAPGISRIYASVLRGGTLRTGDEVTLEP